MSLFKTLKQSIHSPEFYRALRRAPLSFSLKYYFSLALALAVAVALIVSLVAIPGLKDFLGSIAQSLDTFPAGVVMTVQNGILSANATSTMALHAPDAVRSFFGDQTVENLIVIDASSTFSESSFGTYHTVFLATRDSIVAGYDGQLRIQPFKDFATTTMDKAKVQSVADGIRARLGWVPAGVVFGAFLAFFFMFAGILLYLFPIAFLVWGVARAHKIPAGYGTAYQFSLHAASVGLLFLPLKLLLLPSFPFSYFMILTLIVFIEALINLKPEKKGSKEEEPSVVSEDEAGKRE